MEQVLDKSSFQIILHSNNEDDLSEFWQGQCWYLYDELSRALPKGSIKPLALESGKGEKADALTLFVHAVVIEITAKILVEKVFEAIKNWHRDRSYANIEINCPDGNTFKITKESLPKLINCFCENPHLSICEALSLFNNFNE